MKTLAFLAALTLAAQTQNLTGTWQLALHGDHKIPMGLELAQEESKLTGTLTFMGKDIPVSGEIKGEEFTISGKAVLMSQDGESSLNFTGKLKEDGTIGGDIQSPHGVMKWSGERFRTRKAKNAKP